MSDRRRRPNPWVTVPVLVAAVVGAVVGWTVTEVTCLPERCPALAGLFAVLGALTAATGMLIVVVLAIRSLDEWRETERGGGGGDPQS